MSGTIIRRGKHFRLKFDLERSGGKRETRFVSFRGTRKEAQTKLAELIASVGRGTYVEANKVTIAAFVRSRVDQWEAAGIISARTAQRYRQLVEHQIVPHLGAILLQKLRPLDIEAWHAALRTSRRQRGNGTLAPRTISHAHKVLAKALADAAKNEVVHRNVARQHPPKVPVTDDEMVIVRDLPALLAKLDGSRLRLRALLGLFCGLRIGEVLALRHSSINGNVLQIREALEQTKAHGIRIKGVKTKAGRRDVTLPDLVLEALHAHRREALELRLMLGLGRLPDDTLLFSKEDGSPLSPWSVSKAWGDFATRIGIPEVTFHGLRHTHASQLIDAGVDIVTISKRLGHAKPDITLRIYAHLFKKDDSKAAAAINAALS